MEILRFTSFRSESRFSSRTLVIKNYKNGPQKFLKESNGSRSSHTSNQPWGFINFFKKYNEGRHKGSSLKGI